MISVAKPGETSDDDAAPVALLRFRRTPKLNLAVRQHADALHSGNLSRRAQTVVLT